MLIEIKPSRQLSRPKPPKKKTKSYMRESFEFIKNKAKWSAASKYADDNGAVFKIITEKDFPSFFRLKFKGLLAQLVRAHP